MNQGLCLSFLSQCVTFICCCGGAVQLFLGFFSEGIVPYIAVDLCLGRRGEFRIFPYQHIELPFPVCVFSSKRNHNQCFVSLFFPLSPHILFLGTK